MLIIYLHVFAYFKPVWLAFFCCINYFYGAFLVLWKGVWKRLAYDGAKDAMIDCSALSAYIYFINRKFGKGLRLERLPTMVLLHSKSFVSCCFFLFLWSIILQTLILAGSTALYCKLPAVHPWVMLGYIHIKQARHETTVCQSFLFFKQSLKLPIWFISYSTLSINRYKLCTNFITVMVSHICYFSQMWWQELIIFWFVMYCFRLNVLSKIIYSRHSENMSVTKEFFPSRSSITTL